MIMGFLWVTRLDVKELDKPVEPDHETVLQFESHLENSLEYSDAYKHIWNISGRTLEQFDNNSPYSIMSGPDKNGFTGKVHFITNLKNPIIKRKYVEHHLKTPASVPLMEPCIHRHIETW